MKHIPSLFSERKLRKRRTMFPARVIFSFLLTLLTLAVLPLCTAPSRGESRDRLYDISQVLNRKSIRECQDKSVVEKLEQNGFVILENTGGKGYGTRWKHFYEVYEGLRYEDEPAFITTDAALHYAHEVFAFSLENIEESALFDEAEELLTTLVNGCREQVKTAPSQKIREAATANLAITSTALSLLDPPYKIDSSVEAAVSKEKALILKAAGEARSPLLGYYEDYSQYKPRGHYTKNSRLKQYFQAMTWLGRAELKPREEPRLLQALLLTLALQNSGSGEKNGLALWKGFNKNLELFIGPCDNPTPADYIEITKKVWGRVPGFKDIENTELMGHFASEARTLSATKTRIVNPIERNPDTGKIEQDPETGESKQSREEGFRLMGQRFIADGHIMQQLVYPAVGTSEHPRNMPSGLDVMSVLGSGKAESLQRESQKSFKNYEVQLETLQKEFKTLPDSTWRSSAYWAWLDSLRSLFGEKSKSHPAFMRSPEWQKKSLNTALASWAELRHDTILYAKCSLAEGGEGRHFMPMALSQGYVEPEVEVYSKIGGLMAKIHSLLDRKQQMKGPMKEVLSSYESVVNSLCTISRKELKGQPLTAGEFNTIREFGRVMEHIHKKINQTKKPSRGGQIEDSTMAVVADVHTDLVAGECLEEGVGLPMEILVIAPVEGKPVIAKGAIFTHYEFRQPAAKRLNDSEWEHMVTAGHPPQAHQWLDTITVGIDNEKLWERGDESSLSMELPPGTKAGALSVKELRQISWTPAGGDFSPHYPPAAPFNYSGYDQIVYYSKDNSGGSRLWVTKNDGTGKMALTPESQIAIDPCWLPFECKLVFSAAPRQGGSHNLMLYDYETTETYCSKAAYPYSHKTSQLTKDGKESLNPASFYVKPSGSDWKFEERVLYSSNLSGSSQLYILDPGTTSRKRSSPPNDSNPGTRSIRQLTSLPGDNCQGAFSPFGGKVAFTSRRNGTEDIWLTTLEGKKAVQLTKNAGSNSQPAWSPDGRFISFVSNRAGSRNIWVMNADGSDPTRLTDSKEGDAAPCWSLWPYEIVFASQRNGGVSHLWVMTLEVKK